MFGHSQQLVKFKKTVVLFEYRKSSQWVKAQDTMCTCIFIHVFLLYMYKKDMYWYSLNSSNILDVKRSQLRCFGHLEQLWDPGEYPEFTEGTTYPILTGKCLQIPQEKLEERRSGVPF